MSTRLYATSILALFAASGCLLRTSTGIPAAVPAGGPPPAEGYAGGPIEAGCTFNAGQIRPEQGDQVQVMCPPGCATTGGLWGTEVYTADSSICRAAIHAGATPPSGGLVTVQREPGRPAYRGSMHNGIESNDYGSYGASYRFVGVTVTTAAAPQAPTVIEAGCSFNATQIQDGPGGAHRVSCPAGCTGAVWGSDTYTADSSICVAAIHAGLVGERGGGEVTVILEPGRPAYRGSRRHGIQSSDYGAYRASYRLER
jgi:hypothetical protein